MTFRGVLRKSAKIGAWVAGILIGIILILVLLLQLPPVQLFLTGKVVSFLEGKLKTKVRVAGINVAFPKSVVLEGVYLEDLKHDTLLYGKRLAVDLDLLALRKQQVIVHAIEVNTLTAHIRRILPDSSFNYSFILKAFSDSAAVTKKDTAAKPWVISLDKINLQQIYLTYDDETAKDALLLQLGSLNLSFDELDLAKSVYKVRNLELANTRFSFVSRADALPDSVKVTAVKAAASPSFTTGLKKLALNEVHVFYQSLASGQTLKADIGKAGLTADTLDLATQHLALDKFSLSNSFLTYRQEREPKKKPGVPATSPDSATALPWRVRVNDLELDRNFLAYNDFNSTPLLHGLDFSHLFVSDLGASASQIRYSGTTMHAELTGLHLKEKSGFEVKILKTRFHLTQTQASLTDLVFETGNSLLHANLQAGFRSFARLAQEYPDMSLTAAVTDTKLSVQDALYFQPDLLKSLPLRLNANTVLAVATRLSGKVNDLNLESLSASGLQQTLLAAKGTIRNLPDLNRTAFDLTVLPFETSAADLKAVLPAGTLPTSLTLPARLRLTAALKGSVHDFNTHASLATSLGNVLADLHLKTVADFSDGSYSGRVSVLQADLGTLLRQQATLGKCNAIVSVTGSGFKPEVINARANAVLTSLDYQHYTYRNATAVLTAKPSVFSGKIDLADSNLTFTIQGGADFRKDIPHYTAEADLKNISLKALHLTTKDIRSRVKLKADLRFKTLDNINGNLDIRKLAVVSQGKVYAVDSLLYISLQEKEKTDIKIDSDILSGRFQGNINFAGLAGALTNHFNRYFKTSTKPPDPNAKPQQFAFELKLRNTSLFTDVLVPGLDSLKPGEIKGSFDSQTARLDLSAQVFLLKYAGVKADSLQFTVTSNPQRLLAGISVARVQQANIRLYRTTFSTRAEHDTLYNRLSIRDSTQQEKYRLTALVQRLQGDWNLHLLPDSLLLNAQAWQASQDNAVRFAKTGFFINDFNLTSGSQQVLLDNVNGQVSSVKAGFKDFQLATLAAAVRSDTNWVEGLLNGQISLFRQGRDTVITSDLTLAGLTYTGKPVGDLRLIAAQNQPGRFDVQLNLTGNDNDLQVKGFYLTAGANVLNFDTDCRKLNLATFAPFVKDQLRQLSGTASGSLHIAGTPEQPRLDGKITFDTTVINLTQFNSPLKADGQSMRFDDRGIHFDGFRLQDAAGQTATLQGDVLTRSYRFFRLALHLSTDAFQVLNSTADDNKMYYGKLLLSSETDIRGTSDRPIVAANLKVAKGSNLTYVVQQDEGTVAGQEGVEVWFNKDTENDPFVKKMIKQTAADTGRSSVKGFELTTNIEIDSTSTFAVVIDPVAGDQLKVRGETTLSLSMNPAGEIDLTGRYQVLSGTYNLSFFNLVKREFSINKNSSITWSGDPLNAALNIQAGYKVITSPLELMETRLASDREKQQYRQRMAFLVLLNVKGVLTKPEISFALDMPQDKQNELTQNVAIRLKEINADESELNKQVFALFLLQRFFAENPLQSSSGSTESTVRSSVSKLLTEQLSRLTSQVKGVELSLDVNSSQDYTTGQAQGNTKLELGLSKNLLNDRLVVKVAGNVNVEGSSTTSQQSLSDFVGDLRLEYKITKDGRLRLTGFRQRNFDLVSGELIETGGGVIYIRDYNAFKELFSGKVKE